LLKQTQKRLGKPFYSEDSTNIGLRQTDSEKKTEFKKTESEEANFLTNETECISLKFNKNFSRLFTSSYELSSEININSRYAPVFPAEAGMTAGPDLRPAA